MNRPDIRFRIILEVEDADLIHGCHRNTHNVNEKHASYHRHLNSLDLHDNHNAEVNLEIFRNLRLRPRLRRELLVGTATDILLRLSNLLLHHDCTIENFCKRHFHLIMKLRILLKTSMSRTSIFEDFFIFRDVGLGSRLMSAYFMKFVDNFDSTYFFFTNAKGSVLEYFIENVHSNLVPYLLNLFKRYSHDCVANENKFLFALLTKYGARNLDRRAFYVFYHFVNYRNQFRLSFPLREMNRIKMRVVQVVILFRNKLDITMEMLTASHLEPYLTEEEYKNTFINIFHSVRHIINENLGNMLNESWDWYKGIFKIEDNDPVTPRTLQEICRYWIRRNLSYNKQIPNGVNSSIGIPDNLKNYLSFKDFLVTYNILRNFQEVANYIQRMYLI